MTTDNDLVVGARLRDEVDRLYAKIQRLEAALEQIIAVCNDNESAPNGILALTFIRDVATKARLVIGKMKD